jgi:ammonium transporter, Amt family
VLRAVKLLRTTTEAEVDGIDLAEHAEQGYDLSTGSGGSGGGAFALAGIAPAATHTPPAAAPEPAPVAEQATR